MWHQDRSEADRIDVEVTPAPGTKLCDLTVKNLRDEIVAKLTGAGSTARDIRNIHLSCEQLIRRDGTDGTWRVIANDDIAEYEDDVVVQFDTLFDNPDFWFLGDTDGLADLDVQDASQLTVHAYIAPSRALEVTVVDLWKPLGFVSPFPFDSYDAFIVSYSHLNMIVANIEIHAVQAKNLTFSTIALLFHLLYLILITIMSSNLMVIATQVPHREDVHRLRC